MRLLSAEERLLFSEWCFAQSKTSEAFANQIEEMMAHTMGDSLAKRERRKAMAFTIVAIELSSEREDCSLGAVDEVNQKSA